MTLRELRKKKNLSQKQLGKILNVTSQAIGNYEKGKRFSQVLFAEEYSKALGITLEELIEILKQTIS